MILCLHCNLNYCNSIGFPETQTFKRQDQAHTANIRTNGTDAQANQSLHERYILVEFTCGRQDHIRCHMTFWRFRCTSYEFHRRSFPTWLTVITVDASATVRIARRWRDALLKVAQRLGDCRTAIIIDHRASPTPGVHALTTFPHTFGPWEDSPFRRPGETPDDSINAFAIYVWHLRDWPISFT